MQQLTDSLSEIRYWRVLSAAVSNLRMAAQKCSQNQFKLHYRAYQTIAAKGFTNAPSLHIYHSSAAALVQKSFSNECKSISIFEDRHG